MITPSKTNPRGAIVKDQPFKDLVASIKEKGILIPIMVRKVGKNLEIVAGHRRFAAAQELKLSEKEIPVQLVEMNDVEAYEAQIIENLQRADLHPLDEGNSYRALIEKSSPRYEAKDVAIKIGKSESFVRGRLALTNLSPACQKAFREGKITISQALMIARLEEDGQQDKILKLALRGDDEDDLYEAIQNLMFTDLSNRPWAKDAKLTEMLGDHTDRASLFGDKKISDDPAAHGKMMAAFIEHMIRKNSDEGIELVKISTTYGTPKIKGALGQDQYKILNSKEEQKKAHELKKAIVVEGYRDLGQVYWIGTAKQDIEARSVYRATPAERAARKKQLANARSKAAREAKALTTMSKKFKWPMSNDKSLEAFCRLALAKTGGDTLRILVKGKGWEIPRSKDGWGTGTHPDYALACKNELAKLKGEAKYQLAWEIFLAGTYSGHRGNVLKAL